MGPLGTLLAVIFFISFMTFVTFFGRLPALRFVTDASTLTQVAWVFIPGLLILLPVLETHPFLPSTA